jgi:hypothetical protein
VRIVSPERKQGYALLALRARSADAFLSRLAASILDQDAAHGLASRGEEMTAANFCAVSFRHSS